MLARLLRFAMVLVVVFAALSAFALWSVSMWLSLAAFWLIVLVSSWFLAIEFILSGWANRRDPAPGATLGQWVAAWRSEVVMCLRVFAWRQPFRANAVPDLLAGMADGRRGVVFVHGFVCNRGLWTPWLRRLRAEGRVCVAVNLEPVFGSIDGYAPLIEDAVKRVTAATGLAPVLVCHSMGGLAARAWLRAQGPGAEGDARVRHIVTIGTPHCGTWLGHVSHATNGRQMRHRGEWVRRLAQDEPPGRGAIFTCWYSNCDNIVFPASTATLPGACNRLVPGQAHVALAFSPQVMEATLEAIRLDRWPAGTAEA